MEVDEFKPNIKEEKSSEDSVDEFNGESIISLQHNSIFVYFLVTFAAII